MRKITYEEVMKRAKKIKPFRDCSDNEFDRLRALIDCINIRLEKLDGKIK